MTLAEKTAERLTRVIRDNRFEAGDKLPTEKELCALLDVGRNTLREALKLLASRNVITIRQGAGIFIAPNCGVVDDPLGFAMIADREKLTADLMQIREMIEPPIASLAAQNALAEDVAALGEILGRLESAMTARERFTSLDMAYHRKIAECTHNLVINNLIPVICHGVEVFAREVTKPEYAQTLFSHRRIFEAIRDGRAFDAESEMRFHIAFNQKRYQQAADEPEAPKHG